MKIEKEATVMVWGKADYIIREVENKNNLKMRKTNIYYLPLLPKF